MMHQQEHEHTHGSEHGHMHMHHHSETQSVINRLARAIGHLEKVK